MPTRAHNSVKCSQLLFMLYPVCMEPPMAGACSRQRLLPLGSLPRPWAEALGTFASFFLLPKKEALPFELFIGLHAGRLSCP